MALSKKAKVGIAVGVGVVALVAFGGTALADDVVPGDEPDDEPDDEPGDEPEGPIPDFDEPFNSPPPPVCNYSGCGAPFDNTHATPTALCVQLQVIGYPINCAAVAVAPGNQVVSPQRDWWRKFQRDFNRVRVSPPAPAASPLAFAPVAAHPKLAEDGLPGNRTIKALELARAASLNGQMPWPVAVQLAG
jgi:hypothetical protein